jgi:hypothetical protein
MVAESSFHLLRMVQASSRETTTSFSPNSAMRDQELTLKWRDRGVLCQFNILWAADF